MSRHDDLGTCEMDGTREHWDDGHEIYWHCEKPAVVTMRVSRPCGDPYEMRVCGEHAEELADAGAEVMHGHDNDGTVEGCPGCFWDPRDEPFKD